MSQYPGSLQQASYNINPPQLSNGNSAPLQLDVNGNLKVVGGPLIISNFPAVQPVSGSVAVTNFPASPIGYQVLDSTVPTYSCAVFNSGIAAPVYVSYFLTISNNDTKIIRVKRIGFSDMSSTAAQHQFGIYIGTTITGGTPTALVPVSYDNTNSASIATVTQYSTGTTPTLASGGLIRVWSMFAPTSSTLTTPSYIEEDFGVGSKQSLVIRPGQTLALTYIGGTEAGAAVNAFIEWTEQAA